MTPTQKPIALIGFMGAGKTTAAKKLAKGLNSPAFDLDSIIETNEGQSITEIFAGKGEDYFRACEAKYLRQLNTAQHFILSVGGGTPCFHDNMKWLNEHFITIYLELSVALIVERLLNAKVPRPLLAAYNTKALLTDKITEMLAARTPFYTQAHLTFSATNIKSNEALKALIQIISNYSR